MDYLADLGWLSDDVWLAHGIHFNGGEIGRLGRRRVGIAHCPSSNMLLGSGQCPVLDLEHAGCRIGLAVDGSASNDSSNLMQEVRQALLLQRLRYGPERVTHDDALRWATAGGAGLLHRDAIGELAPGRLADLALFKLDELRFSGSGDPVAALVLCGAHRADHVAIGGRWRVRNGTLVDLDTDRLRREHHAHARALFSAAG
jgi:8-oxoguanine deaminase